MLSICCHCWWVGYQLFSLTNFKLTQKWCFDLTLLCIDNQYLFLQCLTAIYIPASGCKISQFGHIPPYSLIPMLNLCPVLCNVLNFFGNKPDGLHVTSLILGNNRPHRPVCAKTISSLVRKNLCVAKTHMSLGTLKPEFLHWLDSIFPPLSLLQIGTRILCSVLHWASLSRCFFGKYQTFIYIKFCRCWAAGP